MGCDWYNVHCFSGIGFIVTVKEFSSLKDKCKDNFNFVVFRKCDDGCGDVQVFVYDKSTFVSSEIDMPGQYETTEECYKTKVTVSPNLAERMSNSPEAMSNEFSKECSYFSILTNYYIGGEGQTPESYMDDYGFALEDEDAS